MAGAADNGHFEMIKYLHSIHAPCSEYAIHSAATKGRLDIIKWMHQNGIQGFSSSTMDCAAAAGQLQVVRWLDENRKEGCTTCAVDWAVWYEHLDVLEYLIRKGKPYIYARESTSHQVHKILNLGKG